MHAGIVRKRKRYSSIPVAMLSSRHVNRASGLASFRVLLDTVRSRFMLKMADAVLTWDLRVSRRPGPISRATTNYKRIHAVVRAVNAVGPAVVTWAEGCLHRDGLLPFAVGAEVLDFGSAATVYRIRRQEGFPRDMVMKVLRASLGRPTAIATAQAAALNECREFVLDWYLDTGVLVPVNYLVLHSPLLGRAAVAGLQPYVGGEQWDFFDLAEDGRLQSMLAEHADFRSQFKLFVERTAELLQAQDCCLDLIGWRNLLVVKEGGRPALKVIDYGIFNLELDRKRRPDRARTALARVDCLMSQYALAFGGPPKVNPADRSDDVRAELSTAAGGN
jgi:hypothetical protein